MAQEHGVEFVLVGLGAILTEIIKTGSAVTASLQDNMSGPCPATVLPRDAESFLDGNNEHKFLGRTLCPAEACCQGWPSFLDLHQKWPGVSLPQVQIALQVTASSPQ